MFQVQSNRNSCTWTCLTLDLTCIACFILSLNNLSAEFDGYMKREFLAVVLIHRKIELLGCWVFSTIHEWNWLGVSADALEKSTGLPVVTISHEKFVRPSVQKLPEETGKRQQTNPFESGFTSSHLGGDSSKRSHRDPGILRIWSQKMFSSALRATWKWWSSAWPRWSTAGPSESAYQPPGESHGNGPMRMKDDVG